MGWISSARQFATNRLAAFQSAVHDEFHPHDRNGADTSLDERWGGLGHQGMSHDTALAEVANAVPWRGSPTERIYLAFDASQPVGQPHDLLGRDAEVAALLGGILHRRNHGIVTGPRGSGKTSLVRVFGQHADREGVIVLYSACDSATSFGELMRDFLEQIPTSSVDPDEGDLFRQRIHDFGPDSTPHQATSILGMIKYSQTVIVVDEFDRVRETTVRTKLASLLKLISDSRLPVRFVLVGGGNTFGDVVNEHASLIRHITRVSTEPLSEASIDQLLDNCAARCGMRFTDEGKKLVGEIACGSPYHARFFGMHAALAALDRDRDEIGSEELRLGLGRGFDEWASLNQGDAATFRSVLDSERAPERLVAWARQLTQGSLREANTDEAQRERERGDGDHAVSALEPALLRSDDGVEFRDATAPQFLIALQHVSTGIEPGKNARKQAGV